MTIQQAIDYLNYKFPGVWENETLDHEELLTMLSDFYDMGFESGRSEGYDEGYEDGQNDPWII